MTPRERLLTVLRGGIPDRVPVSPDFSNMIPARLTGVPFWEIYLYNNPPIWEAYIECAKHFGIDALMDGYFPLTFPEEVAQDQGEWENFIVYKDDDRIVVQSSRLHNGSRQWHNYVDVYYAADPPTLELDPGKIGLPAVPEHPVALEGVKPVDTGPEGLKQIMQHMGDSGLVGVSVTSSCALCCEKDIFYYYDHPQEHERMAWERLDQAEARFARILAMEVKPDFICVGGSGTLVFQTASIFRQLTYPAVARSIELAETAGLPSHLHSCGPEKELVRIMAEETELTVIDPLETPPMGDCDLSDLKREFGRDIVLKGNLHTTEVMLKGTPMTVAEKSRTAIEDAAEGGRFILSTGDQCGRDTPDENIFAMVDAVERYGRY